MKLLVESIDNKIQLLTEEIEGNQKNYFIEGIYLQAGIKNKNDREYPFNVMKKEVDRYRKEVIDTNRAIGELGHPANPEINPERASHKIISLIEDGNNFIGKALILDTPQGEIVKGLLKANVSLGVSSRGLGSLKEVNGKKYVCDDFMLVTAADIVYDPSAPDAFVTALMESKEWVWENGQIIEQEYEIKQEVNKVARTGLNEEKLLTIFKSVLNRIN
jgi:hypothetical protein